MIKLTKLNGEEFLVNVNQICFIEAKPDTHITMAQGQCIIVREDVYKISSLIESIRNQRQNPSTTAQNRAVEMVN